jgi:hypothetical protein
VSVGFHGTLGQVRNPKHEIRKEETDFFPPADSSTARIATTVVFRHRSVGMV